jgi:hypothetical protein
MILTGMRRALRKSLFQFLSKIAETEDARAMTSNTLKGLLHWHPGLALQCDALPLPYGELSTSDGERQPCKRSDVIIITARFRSGSTLLWNLFRHMDGITAYYEPFNERRWFDPHTRGGGVDCTHKQVTDYWREYDGLEILGQYYHESWTAKNLFMDATFWEPDMKRYVEILIDKAPGRPMLQFNRIDLRLPWFRRHFPAATIIHLYRHPRDQWCSSLLDPGCFPKDARTDQFPPHDKFYLRHWANDLKYHFPFLEESTIAHPYQMFYYIWKLSYIFGVHFSHYSIAYEHILDEPELQLQKLIAMLGIKNYDIGKLQYLITPSPTRKWTSYADDAWFRKYETLCETVLADFFGA